MEDGMLNNTFTPQVNQNKVESVKGSVKSKSAKKDTVSKKSKNKINSMKNTWK
jgi:hypothetical protein